MATPERTWIDEPAGSASDLRRQLRAVEDSLPYRVVGAGCQVPEVGADPRNFWDGVAAFDADELGRLVVKRVPRMARGSGERFRNFVAPLLDDHELLDHALVRLGGSNEPVLLLRQRAAPPTRILRGDGTWGWEARVKGRDIVVEDAVTTAFGGSNDPDDSGETASGFPTRGHPDLLGCAVPFAYTGDDPVVREALGGSPIPRMPYGIHPDGTTNPDGAHVRVTDPATGRSLEVPVVDRGPAKNREDPRPLDLTVAAARFFDPSATATDFRMTLDYRILDGAVLAGLAPLREGEDGFPGRVVSTALAEFHRYGGVHEGDAPLRERIEQYWNDLDISFRSVSVPWSAIFVSWVVREAGATEAEFRFAGAHARFVYWAIKNRAESSTAFAGRRLADYAPRPGDIVHNNRGGNEYDFDYAASHWQYPSHSVIVVERAEDENEPHVVTVGGNESDSIRENRVPLEDDGTIRRRERNPYICVLENRKG